MPQAQGGRGSGESCYLLESLRGSEAKKEIANLSFSANIVGTTKHGRFEQNSGSKVARPTGRHVSHLCHKFEKTASSCQRWHCVFRLQKRELISPFNWSVFRRRVTTPIIYLPPAASFGALFFRQNTPRDSTTAESTSPASPENPPFAVRHHSVVFNPESPLCFRRFFLGSFFFSKHLPQDHGSYTHSPRRIAVKKQHS